MSRFFSLARAHLRQWTYPREFRIDPGARSDWASTVVGAALRIMKEAEEKPPETQQGDIATAADSVSNTFAISLCNEHFKLRRKLKRFESTHGDSSELDGLQSSLQDVKDLLREHNIECEDLTGQVYSSGRLDFESVGPGERKPGVTEPRIAVCERPVVRLNGKIIQKAKGLVELPGRTD